MPPTDTESDNTNLQSHQPIFDPSYLEEIEAIADARKASRFVRELVDTFHRETKAQLDILGIAISVGNTNVFDSCVHRLLSSCTSIGAVRLASYLKNFQSLVERGDVAILHGQYTTIMEEYNQFNTVLKQSGY